MMMRRESKVDRKRAKAKARLGELLERIWERNRDVEPGEVERAVAEALPEVRQSRAKRDSN